MPLPHPVPDRATEELSGGPASAPKIGEELLRWRKAAGLSLDELARLSGVSKSILSQVERDRANPTLATIWRICAALDHSPEHLFGPVTPAAMAVAAGSTQHAGSQPGRAPHTGLERLTAHATPEISSEDGLCRLRILGAIGAVDRVQWYEMLAQPGGELLSAAHGAGTLENLTLMSGTLRVEANGARLTAAQGETVRYGTAEGMHRIVNEGTAPARAMMVCLL